MKEISSITDPESTDVSRRRIRARPTTMEDHQSFDIWNKCLNSCMFLRKNRRASRCPTLRKVLTRLRDGNMDLAKAKISQGR